MRVITSSVPKLTGESSIERDKLRSATFTHSKASLITQMSGFCGVASPLNERGSSFVPNDPARRNYAAAAIVRTLDCVKTAKK